MLILARTNDTGEAVGVWIPDLTGVALRVIIIYNAGYALSGTHSRYHCSGFEATLGSIQVDADTATSVSILVDRALSVKLYVVTIILGMCTTFLWAPLSRFF